MMQKVRSDFGAQTEKNLNVAIRDGMAHASMLGAGETYFSAFAIFLHASNLQIGILASVPQLFGSFCQLLSLRLTELIKSRRWLLVAGARLQAFSFIPILLIPLLFGSGPIAASVLIFLSMVYFGALGISLPAWNSLIGDLVPPSLRGRYFGRRNQLAGACTLIAMLGAGILLHYADQLHWTYTGYISIFLIAAFARYRSSVWLSRYDDPPYNPSPQSYCSFYQFLKHTPHSNFARFVFFVAFMMFSTHLAAPYFTVYMLRYLNFTYLEFTLVTSVAAVTQILTLHHWGGIVDRFGSKKVLTYCGYGAASIPLLWLFSTNLMFIVAIQLYSGIVWAGFNLATSTFMFDAVTPEKRARCAAYQALMQGMFILAGTLLGAKLSKVVPSEIDLIGFVWSPASPLLVVFLISSLLRGLVVRVFLNRFHEVREVESIRPMNLIFHLIIGSPESRSNVNLLTAATKPKKTKQYEDDEEYL